jgi:RHS repeat-associated protein
VDRNGNTIRYEYERYSKTTGTTASCAGTPAASVLCSKRVARVVDPKGVELDPTGPVVPNTPAGKRALHILYQTAPVLPNGAGTYPASALTGPVGGKAGRIKQIIDHKGRALDFYYDTSGYLTDIQTWGGQQHPSDYRKFTFEYSGSGAGRQLTGVRDPENQWTRAAYDASAPGTFGDGSIGRRATSVTTRRDHATTYTYPTATSFKATAPGDADTTYVTPDATGRTETITNDVGAVTKLSWSADNYLESYERAFGTAQAAKTDIKYHRLGIVEWIRDPLQRVTSFGYEFGTEAGITNAGVDDGKQYVADLKTQRRPRDPAPGAPTITFGLDSRGNVTSRTYAGKPTAQTAYDNWGQVTWEQDELGNRTNYPDYDANGLPQMVVDPRQQAGETVTGPNNTQVAYDGTWRYRYDEVGNLLAVTDPRGGTSTAAGQPHTTSFTYDAFDQVLASQTPKCTSTSTDPVSGCPSPQWIARTSTYDKNGNLASSTDGRGKTTTHWYSAMDQVQWSESPAVAHHGEGAPAREITGYEYDPRENLSKIIAPNGSATGTEIHDYVTIFGYDGANRLTQEIRRSRGSSTPCSLTTPVSCDADLVTSYAYDLRDNLVGSADPRTNTAGGAPEANASDPAKQRWSALYDVADNRTDEYVRHKISGVDPYHSQTTYDVNNNVKEVLSARGTQAGADPAKFKTVYEYDVRDEVVSVERGGARKMQYVRDAVGDIESVVSPRGSASASLLSDFATSYTYNRNRELKSVALPKAPGQRHGEATVSYYRDAVGDPVQIIDPRGNTFNNAFYDTGELKHTQRPSWWTTDVGAETEIRERTPDEWPTFDGGQEALPTGPGDFGKVSAQSLPDLLPLKGDTDLRYNAEMRLENVTDTAGVRIDLIRDDVGRLAGIDYPFQAAAGGNPAVDIELRYAFDRNGNLRSSVDGEGQETITKFDQFDRVVEQDAPGALASGGNPNSALAAGPFTRNVTKAWYDANGNTTTSIDARNNTSTMAYDAIDRLISNTSPLGHVTTFGYDAENNETCRETPLGNPSAPYNCEWSNYGTQSEYTEFNELDKVSLKAEYDGGTPVPIVTDYDYDLDGNQIKVTAPGARKTPSGGILPQVSEMRFDGRNRPWVISEGDDAHGDRTVSVREYDELGNLRRTVNPSGVPASINLDNLQPGINALSPDDGTATPQTGPSAADAATYQATVFTTDADNLLTNRWLPTGATDFDASTTDDTADDRRQWRQQFHRDARGRVSQIDAPFATGAKSRARMQYQHYLNGWISESSDWHWINPGAGEDSVEDDQYLYQYDRQGNQTRWTSASGELDEQGDPIPGRSVRRHYYPNGLLLRRVATDPDLSDRRYTYGYNANRSLVEVQDGQQLSGGQPRKTLTDYDAGNRRTKVDEKWSGGKSSKYQYDANDRLTDRWTDGRFDPAGSNTIVDAKKTSFEYDSIGRERRTKVEQSGQSDRLTDKTYWGSGRVANVTRQNGKVCERTYYDTQGRVTRRARTPNSGGCDATTNVRHRIFSYDRNSNRTLETDAAEQTLNAHVYNSRDQLVKWTRGLEARDISGDNVKNSTITYRVSGAGAITDKTEVRPDIAPAQSAVTKRTLIADYTVQGYRLISVEGTQKIQVDSGTPVSATIPARYFKYDDTGAMDCMNTATAPSDSEDHSASSFCSDGTKHTYDAFSRLTRTKTPDSTDTTTYAYDALDRRDFRCKNGTAQDCNDGTKFDYGYVGLSEQLSIARETGNKTRDYDYDAGLQRIGQNSFTNATPASNSYRSYFTDPNGTVIGLEQSTDGDIGEANRYDYDPFGKQEGTGSDADLGSNPFRFQGHHYDSAVATYDMQARPYRPDIERFTTPDRFEDALGDFALQSDPLTQDRYAFGAGNPVNNVEFDGHGPEGLASEAIADADGKTGRDKGQHITPKQRAAITDGFNDSQKNVGGTYHQEKNQRESLKATGTQPRQGADPVPREQCLGGVGCVQIKQTQEEAQRSAAAFGNWLLNMGLGGAGGFVAKQGLKLACKVGCRYADNVGRAVANVVTNKKSTGLSSSTAKPAPKPPARRVSGLDLASAAANKAASKPGSIFIKNIHLSTASNNKAKFASSDIPQIQKWVAEGLRSEGAEFRTNPLENTFRVVADLGRPIGTRGETKIRAAVTDDGRVINAFPVKSR